MCAIGMRYIPKERNFSDKIYCYALLKLDKAIYNPNLHLCDIQAGLLVEYFGIFSGNDLWFKKSRSLHSQLAAIARETGMFLYNPLDRYDDEWSLFVLSEGRKRASYGLYLIDGQMATLLNYPPTSSHYEIRQFFRAPMNYGTPWMSKDGGF